MELPSDVGIRWAAQGEKPEDAQLSLLSAQERARYEGIRHARARTHFLLGRVALRSLLADRLDMRAAAVPLVVAPDGGVDVKDRSVHVSIAHAGGVAVAVAAERVIGVDLEHIKPRSQDLAAFLLHPSERGAYGALPLDPVRRLILYWTLKEAVLKALRTGLRRSPKRVRLAINLAHRSALAFLEDRGTMELRFREREGFFVSVAFDR